VEHFQKILQSTDIPYKDMLFFDDEDRNIRSVCYICSLIDHSNKSQDTCKWCFVCTKLGHFCKICRHDHLWLMGG
jgi:hypothetical protein